MSSTLLRLRIGIMTLVMAILAFVAGGIFDRQIWALLLAIVIPAAVASVVRSLSVWFRVSAMFIAVMASIALIVYLEGGLIDEFGSVFVDGLQRLLTTEWPSPDRAELIGVVALVLAATTGIATEIAGRQRWHLLALVPPIATYIAITSLSAPLGVRLLWLLPLGLLFAVFAAMRPDAGVAERWMLLGGERRMIPIVLLAALVAGSVSVPVALARRADPRRNDPASQTAALLDPIEATLALRAIDPPLALHEISSGAQLPGRWRTAALTDYDGQRWTPALTLRPIGRRLAPASPDSIDFTLTFLDDDISLVPLPGSPITVDARLETDSDRTVVRLTERLDQTTEVAATSLLSRSRADAQSSGLATRTVDETVTGLTEFASTLSGDGTILEQLRQLESTMRDDFVLASGASGAGLQRALIERFLRDTQRGTAEQFATAFVLLARSLGVDARVATGYITDAQASSGVLTLTSADAAVWPEVRLRTGGWVAFDPVPDSESSDAAPPPEEPAVQTPAAAQPPIAPPPEPSTDSQSDDDLTQDAPTTALSSLRLWLQRVGIGFAVLLLPVLLAIALILGLKRHRRQRLLKATAASDRVVGAWAVATNRLVDAGLDISPSATNGDIATAGAPLVSKAQRELLRLAGLSSAVTFGVPPRPELLAEDASSCLGQIESSMVTERTRAERLRWRLSLRSLRRSTRSPIAN